MGSLRTRLCRELDIEHPIFSAGIGGVARPELVAAVSNAGGCGIIGASGLDPDEIRREIASARGLTDRPFGVNVIIDEVGWAATPEDRAFVRDEVSAAVEERVSFVALFWGDPAPYVANAHENGVKVLIQVGSVEEAEAAAAAGVDAVIAQGFEAGGHVKGTTSIWELLPATVDAVRPLPVLAAGGIGNGAGVARALRLGAQGVSLGTRFVASEEAWAHPAYKDRLVRRGAADTFYGELYDVWWPGAPHRALRNKTFEEWDAAGRPPPGERPGEGAPIGFRPTSSGEMKPWPRYAIGTLVPGFEGDTDYAPMWAGLSVDDVTEVKPAGEIVSDLVREAERALADETEPS